MRTQGWSPCFVLGELIHSVSIDRIVEWIQRHAVLIVRHCLLCGCLAKHRNVVEFHGWYATEKHVWIVEDLCCGGSLKEVHAMDAQLPIPAIRQFGRDIMEGLFYLHRQASVPRTYTPCL